MQKEWYTQELYNRKVLGVKNLSNTQFKNLRKARREAGRKTLAAGINYDLLMQEKYQLGFDFKSIVDRDMPGDEYKDEAGNLTVHLPDEPDFALSD